MKAKSMEAELSYGARIDRALDLATADFTREDWIRLALASLDQAGVSPQALAEARYAAANGKGVGVNAILIELDEEPPYLTTEHVPA